MGSRIKQVATDIRDKAKTITGITGATVWNNDVVTLRDGAADTVVCPHICIEFEFEGAMSFLHGVKQIDLLCKFHILHRQDDAGDGRADENLDVMDIRDQVLVMFTNYKPSYCGLLQYVTEQPDYDHDNIYHYIVTFRCSFIDTKGSPFDPDSTEWITKTNEELPKDLEIEVDIPPDENDD